jgi:hypothetical protein
MRALPIVIKADADTTLALTVGTGGAAQTVTGLLWDEMLGLVAGLSHPEVRSTYYGLSKVRVAGAPETEDQEAAPRVPRREDPARTAEPPPGMAQIRIPAEEAYYIAANLADLLWWMKGHNAAKAVDAEAGADDRAPHIERLREVRELLISAANKADGIPDAELPF